MIERIWDVQTCIPKSTISGSKKASPYVLPTAPHLSAARFDGPCVSQHVHQFFEIVYIESGSGIHGIGDRYRAASEGDVFLIAPGEVHDTTELQNACKWVVAFEANVLKPNYTDAVAFEMPADALLLLSFFRPIGLETEYFCVPAEERARWLDRLQSLERELACHKPGYEDASRALLVLLLTDIARMVLPNENYFALPKRQLLIRIFRYIESHFAQPISLRDVAQHVGHAPAYLTDLVRRETGRTVLEWIVERRLSEARYLLRETDQTIQQIAEAIGYNHTSHFISQFRRIHGITPNGWRSPLFFAAKTKENDITTKKYG